MVKDLHCTRGSAHSKGTLELGWSLYLCINQLLAVGCCLGEDMMLWPKAISSKLPAVSIPSSCGNEASVLREDLRAPSIHYPHSKENLGEKS